MNDNDNISNAELSLLSDGGEAGAGLDLGSWILDLGFRCIIR